MKKILLFLSLAAIAFSSCHKDKKDDNYYFSFKADGQDVSFTGYIVAARGTDSIYKTLTILGATSATGTGDYLGIYLANSPGLQEFTTGSYHDVDNQNLLLTTYGRNSLEYEAGETLAEEAAANSIPLAHNFTLTITALTNKVVEGTFSGDYYIDADPVNGDMVSISEGKFRLRLIQ